MTLQFDYQGLRQVISGGQCGVDQGALVAAFIAGVSTGGTAPRGFKVSGGSNMLLECFGLTQSHSPDYPPRTEENVKNSDGTLIIAADFDSAGEILTQKLVHKHKKPSSVISVEGLVTEEELYLFLHSSAVQIATWITVNQIQVLNVAGNRDQRDQTAMYDITKLVLAGVFGRLAADNLLISSAMAAHGVK